MALILNAATPAEWDPFAYGSPVHAVWAKDEAWTNPGEGAEVTSARCGGSNGVDFTTSGTGPDYLSAGLGNRPCFDFKNAEEIHVTSGQVTGASTYLTVFRIDAAADGDRILSSWSTGGARRLLFVTGGEFRMYSGSVLATGMPFETGRTYVAAVVFGTAPELWLNGIRVWRGAGTAATTEGLVLGSKENPPNANFLDGPMAGVSNYDSDVTGESWFGEFMDRALRFHAAEGNERIAVHAVLGQSLATGAGGSAVTSASTSPEYLDAIKWDSVEGVPEVLRPPDGNSQAPAISLGNRMVEYHDGGGVFGKVAALTSALSSTAIAQMSQGTTLYNDLIADIASTHGYGPATVRALHLIQGEADMNDGTAQATYQSRLETLSSDFNTDAKAETGQDEDLPLIVCQVNSWPEYSLSAPNIGLAQLGAHVDKNQDVYLVGPKYQLAYQADEIHLTGVGYYHLGEYHARAAKAIESTGTWEPLRPLSAARAGAVITVEFAVPVAPLQFDTTTVTAQTNQGFSYTDDGTPPAISSVALGGNGTSVEITLASTPTGANQKVRYGFTTQYGNLCDSETEVSAHDASTLANWCVHFEMDVTT